MRVIVDRLEGEYIAVELEDKSVVNIPRCLVPDAKEGDVISITTDNEETANRNKKIEEKLKKLFDK